ncbi:hypothetical protein EJB05_20035, partial [Eragrostis curvula]
MMCSLSCADFSVWPERLEESFKLLTFGGMVFSSGFFCGTDGSLPDELNGERLLLNFPSKVEPDEFFICRMKPEARLQWRDFANSNSSSAHKSC